MNAKQKQQLIYGGVAIIAVGTGIYLYNKSQTTPEVQQLEQQPAVAVADVIPKALNRDLVLQKGQTSPEVKALQRLLNVTPVSGFFGSITQAALIKRKGLKSVSLNQFDNAPNLNNVAIVAGGLKIGDTVQANDIAVKAYKNKATGTLNQMLNEVEDIYVMSQNIGKIVGFNATKGALLIKATFVIFPDKLVWVATNAVRKI